MLSQSGISSLWFQIYCVATELNVHFDGFFFNSILHVIYVFFFIYLHFYALIPFSPFFLNIKICLNILQKSDF